MDGEHYEKMSPADVDTSLEWANCSKTDEGRSALEESALQEDR